MALSSLGDDSTLSDFDFTEVLIDLADPGPLLVGMKVDVYFLPQSGAQNSTDLENGAILRAPF